MNDLTELKEYVRVHARGQQIDDYRQILDRIRTDEGDGPESWAGAWCRAAEEQEGRGRHLDACRRYAMARFPFADTAARRDAGERCVAALDRWRAGRGIEPLDVELKGGRLRCWTSGLSTTERKPLLVIMGGIVTVKESWVPLLTRVGKLGMAGIVTELPGIGENTLTYGADSHRMLADLLDAVADRADVAQTHAIALSFSGHLALRCAVDDARIRDVITVGAPIGPFFTDAAWQADLPRVTVDTLAHLTGGPAGRLPDGAFADWALSGEQLAALDIPVHYTASLRDEIIPAADISLLKQHVRRLDLVEKDDVHGSPNHTRETQLWTLASLMKERGVRGPASAVINLMLRLQRRRRTPTA